MAAIIRGCFTGENNGCYGVGLRVGVELLLECYCSYPGCHGNAHAVARSTGIDWLLGFVAMVTGVVMATIMWCGKQTNRNRMDRNVSFDQRYL